VGRSGSGKSTMLHVIGTLDRPSAGSVTVTGVDVARLPDRKLSVLRGRTVGFVFQAFHLMDELTAVENVELPALVAGTAPKSARARALQLLEQVGLSDRANFLPSALSGGQKQRVGVARSLINDPVLVLADEPTGNLDSAATDDVLRLFDKLRDAGQTLVLVTHDQRIGDTADRLVTMRDGEFLDDVRRASGSRTAVLDLEREV